MTTRFHKYHGLGNDFIIVAAEELSPDLDLSRAAVEWCHRHRGIGADGVLVHTPSKSGPGRMTIYNADGSRPEMCGNGLRCIARWLLETGRESSPEMVVETDRGPLRCTVALPEDRDPCVPWQVETDLGAPEHEARNIPVVGSSADIHVDVGPGFDVRAVSMGNPHAVIEVSTRDTLSLARQWGQKLSEHPVFPNRANVEFVYRHDPDRLQVTVYERGCGITQACGTGAAATVAALARDDRSWRDRPIAVELPGGVLSVTVTGGTVRLKGPAVRVFDGDLYHP